MSSLPPEPSPSAETLELGGGGRIPPDDAPRTSGWGRKRFFLIGGAVVGLGAVGAGAFGAWWYLTTGPQPAEALPAGTLGYVSIDLDPSGGQKLDALRTLKKFPAADDELDLSGDLGDIDVTRVLVEAVLESTPCDLDYADDVEPWIGDRAAVAAVDVDADEPAPVVVLQVTDADAAMAAVQDLVDCAGDESLQPGTEVVDDQWLVLATTPDIAEAVVKSTAKGSLADDETFQKWTEAAGDPGVVSMYAAPAAGALLADNLEGLMGLGTGFDEGVSSDYLCTAPPALPEGTVTDPADDDLMLELQEVTCDESVVEGADGTGSGELDEMTDELGASLKDFEGAAVTVRFADGAIEVDVVGDPGMSGEGFYSGDSGAEAIGSLPADTIAAFGLGLADGWVDDLLAEAASSLGEDAETLVQELEDASGLSLPEDAETLLGDSAALAVGGDVDPESVFELEDPSGLPVAAKVIGDPDAIEDVLDRVRPQLGPDGDLLASAAEGDAIAVGPNPDYNDEVLQDGDLAESDSFRSVVPEEDGVSAVLFLDLDRIVALISEGMGDDDELTANLGPLDALGMSAWSDDGVTHARLRISTD